MDDNLYNDAKKGWDEFCAQIEVLENGLQVLLCDPQLRTQEDVLTLEKKFDAVRENQIKSHKAFEKFRKNKDSIHVAQDFLANVEDTRNAMEEFVFALEEIEKHPNTSFADFIIKKVAQFFRR